MPTVSSTLQARLDSGETTLAWCWRITRQDGEVFGFTEHDRMLTFDGTDFEPETGFEPSEIRQGADLAVDAQDAQGVLDDVRITEADILDGRWDNAAVEAWLVDWSDPTERILMRRGSIGRVSRGRVAFVAEVRGLAHSLDQTVGRTFQFGCDAALGDARCQVNLDSSDHRGNGSVASLTRSRAFVAGGLDAFASGHFEFGFLIWSTGANAGRRAEVIRHVNDAGGVEVALVEDPVRTVLSGDTFVIYAGCDKTSGTCAAKFGNIVNFRGFPHIPGTDTVLRYPRRGGHDGQVLGGAV